MVHNGGFQEMLDAIRAELRPGTDVVVADDDRSTTETLIGFAVVRPDGSRSLHHVTLIVLNMRLGVANDIEELTRTMRGRSVIAASLTHGHHHTMASECQRCAVEQVMTF